MAQTPWNDPNVQDALKTRTPDDVYLCCCGGCGKYSYYNQGSHFGCQWCDWSISGDEFDSFLECDPPITLDDFAQAQVDAEQIP